MIAVTAGVAAPLTILAATVAVALLAFTVAEFTRAEPSAGSFITYVETGLGARAGVATALLVIVGYTVAITAVFTLSGGLVAMTLSRYTSWHPWWGPLSLVLTAGGIWLTARGVKMSTSAVGAAVVFQVAIMVAICLVVLVDRRVGRPRQGSDRLGQLTWREREVLALMAEGRSNRAIAERLVVTDHTVEKHVKNIFAALGLPPSADDHRRVLAVLTFLNSR